VSKRSSKLEPTRQRDQRILILAPTGRDAELTARFLADAALLPHVCVTIHEVSGQMQQGAGVVLLTEESLTTHSLGLLARSLMTQPTWSDIPIILLTSGGGESPINTEGLASLGAIGNVSLIERPVRMMTLLSSITAALRARNRQYDVREHLEREVRNKKEIEKAFIQVEEASRLKDEFLATVSHELRTPLNAVLGWTTLLRSNSLDQAGRQRAVETIERNARSQTQLVEDLLDVSRAISGKLRLDAVPIEPRRFIEEAVEALRPTAQARQVRVTEKIEANLDAVYGDPARLRQIVWNLLSNAIKFTARGGRIRLTARRVAANLEIAVMDNGQGIAPEFLPYVFERFRQADMTTTRTHGGLGLGLAIVRQLVELHSGTVGVTSAGVGRGATFTVMLPLITTHQRAKSNGKRSEKTNEDSSISRALRGVRVLVVDDETDTRDLLKAVLSNHGARVTTASSAEAALNLIPRVKPHVLISDIGMPGTDGYALMRKVRSLPPERGGQVPAVALTAYAREQDRHRAIEAGYQLHLAKPIEVEQLSASITLLISDRSGSRLS